MAKTVGLVLEGGGMRGSYTLGVLDAFLDAGRFFPYVIGVSAGACNAASYASRQRGRGQRIAETYGMDRRYVSPLNLLGRGHSMFGMDFIFGDIPDALDPFDYETFYNTGARLVIGCTGRREGRAPLRRHAAAGDAQRLLPRLQLHPALFAHGARGRASAS